MQKYLLDENLSRKLTVRLAAVFPNITHVSIEGLLNRSDHEIWNLAKINNYVLITKDYDFSEMSHLLGCPPKVIKLNCGNKTTEHIADLLSNKLDLIRKFIKSNNCYMEIF